MQNRTNASARVDTGRVSNRRTLRFNTIDDVLAEVDRLIAAERAGTLRRLGNWTLGQALGHLATWANFAHDGVPPALKPPFPIRLILRLRKNKYLHDALPAGVYIPRVEGGTLGIEPISLEDGLERYRRGLERLRNSAPSKPNVLFGPLTHDEWIALNLRHAELHLSFLLPA